MKLVVGLGNPGKEYQQTRHNLGFMVLDLFAEQNKINITKNKFESLLGEDQINNDKILFIKPQTFMNLSGQAVAAVKNFYHIELDKILVIHDDIDLEPGKIRLRTSGSSGGHNGIKSIISALGTENFPRIKIGVGKPLIKERIHDYVLEKFTAEEKTIMQTAIAEAVKKLEDWLKK